MAECVQCGDFTKYSGGLCYKCYKGKESGGAAVAEAAASPTAIRPAKERGDNTWVYNLIKGRIAETLVEQLFLSLGFQVFKYGMENTIPGIMDLLKGVRDEVAMEIRRMPDLVVYKDGKAHFIEVKFRASGSFQLRDIDKNQDYPYQNALIVLVSKKHIKCISFLELEDGKEITPTCRNYLGGRKEFETDKDKIIEYCQYAVKFFENV
ncbi:hypothetical protein [Pontibacter harenae]|uniref:hypothetical protein n=1 Tax=Pontibacter harenae TaxID=2894083 RepID=UPI001E2D381C|nr:hypothetical protein [Pontibacter harenae]MCC9168639.1 hypothetical protein [Pontibacter harenae]